MPLLALARQLWTKLTDLPCGALVLVRPDHYHDVLYNLAGRELKRCNLIIAESPRGSAEAKICVLRDGFLDPPGVLPGIRVARGVQGQPGKGKAEVDGWTARHLSGDDRATGALGGITFALFVGTCRDMARFVLGKPCTGQLLSLHYRGVPARPPRAPNNALIVF